MINLIKLQCPNCGANLEVKEDTKQCFCIYCGTKIAVSDDREHVIRNIDEGRILEAELQYKLRLLELQEKKEQELREREHKRKVCLTLGIIATILALIGTIALILGLNSYGSEDACYTICAFSYIGTGLLFAFWLDAITK